MIETRSFLSLPEELLNLMPFLTGKLALVMLIVLSTISWAIILSKHFKLRLAIQADKQFVSQLRQMSKCLELYERDLVYPDSPLYQIYLAGAQKTALEMVGDLRPKFLAETQLATDNSLSTHQIVDITKAFDTGYQRGWELIKGNGFQLLRWITITALALGLLCTLFFMFNALNEFGRDLASMLIASVVMIVASFLVALPSEWFRRKYSNQYRKRIDRMTRFNYGIKKAFANQLQKAAPVVKPQQKPEPKQTPTPDPKPQQQPILRLPEIEKQKPRYFSLSQTQLAEDDKTK